MKVLIVNNMVPFVWGGAEELAVHLQKNLIAAGYRAETLRIPFQWDPAACIPSQMLMVRAFELYNVDRVIALKFPAYLIRHPHKTLWLLHQYRQAYDLYEAGYTNLLPQEGGEAIRGIIQKSDAEAFRECRRIFTNSKVTQERLFRYNRFDAPVLLPPLNDPELFAGGESAGYIFAGGRVCNMKRQYLLIQAMNFTPSQVKLVIAGPPDRPEDGLQLRQLVDSLGLADRVKLDLRFLPRLELAKYVNEALACAYLPYDEDSLGYVSMEAAAAGKALITTHDSGGVLGLARHRETGWVSAPNPEALADILTQAAANPELTRRVGLAARELWLSMEVNWQNTIERLLK